MTHDPLSGQRPTGEAIGERWLAIMHDPLLSMATLRKQAIEGDLANTSPSLRSLYWRVRIMDPVAKCFMRFFEY
jgi:hypothetical protein